MTFVVVTRNTIYLIKNLTCVISDSTQRVWFEIGKIRSCRGNDFGPRMSRRYLKRINSSIITHSCAQPDNKHINIFVHAKNSAEIVRCTKNQECLISEQIYPKELYTITWRRCHKYDNWVQSPREFMKHVKALYLQQFPRPWQQSRPIHPDRTTNAHTHIKAVRAYLHTNCL